MGKTWSREGASHLKKPVGSFLSSVRCLKGSEEGEEQYLFGKCNTHSFDERLTDADRSGHWVANRTREEDAQQNQKKTPSRAGKQIQQTWGEKKTVRT